MLNYNSVILLFLLSLSAASHAAEETVFLNDDVAIRLYYFGPDTFDPNANVEKPRLALLISGGSNGEYMAQAQYWIGRRMVERGWAVAVPISPSGRKYFIQEADVIPKVVDFLNDLHNLGDAKPLLVGISDGGSAALAIAAQNPEFYGGVIATPGRIWDSTEFKNLNGLPVFLRVGEKDSFLWNKQLPDMVKTLDNAGANIDAGLIPGAKHLFELNWDEFDAWLQKL